MIRGLIFDLDGVITDTAEYHFLAWKRLADEEGLNFSRADNEELRGVSRRESLLRLLKGKIVPEATLEAWMQRKNDYYTAYLDTMTPEDTLEGVLDILHEAKATGLKIGIGSASKNAKPVIEKLKLTSLFDVIGDGYSVVNPKPAPDLFVWVAGGFGLPVSEVLVFEDAAAGIDAAQAAGTSTVGLGHAGVHHADLRLANLAHTSLSAILSHFAEHQSNHG